MSTNNTNNPKSPSLSIQKALELTSMYLGGQWDGLAEDDISISILR